ncbi:MAG: NmrA/HSCARG family protein [Nitrospirae bacterium]|nr:NmrA/HSCARG family protein [Nitrospirota bacterium]
MTQPKIILVTGATGQQGGAVAHSLLRQGQKIRVLTRNPAKAAELAKAGAEVVKGDLTDLGGLAAALDGVDGVFAMSTPFEEGMEAEVQQGEVLADVARAAGVSHFVYTSVASADRNTGIPHFETKRRVEQHIKTIGLPATILRPVFFMENFSTFFRPSKEGILAMPLRSDTKLQMIALKDIGEFGAAAFLRPTEFIGQTIDLAGDELTMPQVATHLSRTMGRPIPFQQMPDNQAEATMGHDFAVMFRWFNTVGYSVDIPALRQRYGIPLTTFAELIKTAAWAKGQ